jgi:hypothetical protein
VTPARLLDYCRSHMGPLKRCMRWGATTTITGRTPVRTERPSHAPRSWSQLGRNHESARPPFEAPRKDPLPRPSSHDPPKTSPGPSQSPSRAPDLPHPLGDLCDVSVLVCQQRLRVAQLELRHLELPDKRHDLSQRDGGGGGESSGTTTRGGGSTHGAPSSRGRVRGAVDARQAGRGGRRQGCLLQLAMLPAYNLFSHGHICSISTVGFGHKHCGQEERTRCAIRKVYRGPAIAHLVLIRRLQRLNLHLVAAL